MENKSTWLLSDEERSVFINALVDELPSLRAKADITQDELAEFIGISRQTFGAIERKTRKMTWNTYLALILFFDYNKSTHNMLRKISAFPDELINHFNTKSSEEISNIFSDEIISKLDAQALHAIRTVMMVEYARCSNISGDAVVKAFDGKSFGDITSSKIAVSKALKNIKKGTADNDE